MTDNAMDKLAELFEGTWPKQYLATSHKKTVQMIRMYFGPFDNKEVLETMKWAACEYDSFPGIRTLTDAISKRKSKKIIQERKLYFEDADKFGYMWDETERDYICIWKPWWNDADFVKKSNAWLVQNGKEPTIRARSKMAILKARGLIDY